MICKFMCTYILNVIIYVYVYTTHLHIHGWIGIDVDYRYYLYGFSSYGLHQIILRETMGLAAEYEVSLHFQIFHEPIQ